MATRTPRFSAPAALLLFAMTAALPAAAQTLNEALMAYKRGDYAAAYRGFRRLAERGNAVAQFNLAVMYNRGKGIARDDVAAARWWRHAAERGHAEAQFVLGSLYRTGEGVPKSLASAAYWFHFAANQGSAGAQLALGDMYQAGGGVRRNLIQAHRWLDIAASRLSSGNKRIRDIAVRARNRVAARLTAAELAWTQRLAQAWRPQKEAPPLSPPRVGGGDSRRIAAVQRALRRLRHYPGPADGILGRQTRAAIRAFQKTAGLSEDGRLSHSLDASVDSAVRAARRLGRARVSLQRSSTGSGFRVDAEGHILTGAHVVRGCFEVRVRRTLYTGSQRVAVAGHNDFAHLALLKGPANTRFATFRRGRVHQPGAPIFVVGHPRNPLLSLRVGMFTGTVAALVGPGGDFRLNRIAAPVLSGYGGGSVLDPAGNVVGVAVSRRKALKTARAAGDIPHDINFAVTSGTARAFLDAEGIAYTTAPSDNARTPEEVVEEARRFTVLVECWKWN